MAPADCANSGGRFYFYLGDFQMAIMVPVQIVVTGFCTTSDKKTGVVFHELSMEGGMLSREIVLPLHKGTRRLNVGHVYTAERTDDCKSWSVGPHAFKWVRQWDDKSQSAEWQAGAEAFEQASKAARLEVKMTKGDGSALADCIRILAAARAKQGYSARIAFDAWLLAELRK